MTNRTERFFLYEIIVITSLLGDRDRPTLLIMRVSDPRSQSVRQVASFCCLGRYDSLVGADAVSRLTEGAQPVRTWLKQITMSCCCPQTGNA